MPGFGLSTAAVYRRFDERPPPAAVADDAPPERFAGLARWVRNDLWDPAVALEPRLEALAHGLVAAGAEATLLCGSGAAIAGLVSDSASAATVQARFAIANPAIRTWAVTPST
jgi:4-diphosphocytidyl-2C-methyl-D-erythritol kinase